MRHTAGIAFTHATAMVPHLYQTEPHVLSPALNEYVAKHNDSRLNGRCLKQPEQATVQTSKGKNLHSDAK